MNLLFEVHVHDLAQQWYSHTALTGEVHALMGARSGEVQACAVCTCALALTYIFAVARETRAIACSAAVAVLAKHQSEDHQVCPP